jgi:DNA (cytosine-5)-methyltransferase 1
MDLAAEWAGIKTVGMCEIDPFCREIFKLRFPGVPIWEDIHDVTIESVRAAGIDRINLIFGGFPCQPISIAGQRRGTEDDRYLWPEMLRVISELQPDWVVAENTDGLRTMGESNPVVSVGSRTITRDQD